MNGMENEYIAKHLYEARLHEWEHDAREYNLRMEFFEGLRRRRNEKKNKNQR